MISEGQNLLEMLYSFHPFSSSSRVQQEGYTQSLISFHDIHTLQAFSHALQHPQGGAKLLEQQSGINWRASSCVSGTILTEPSSWRMCFANAVLAQRAVRRAVRCMLAGWVDVLGYCWLDSGCGDVVGGVDISMYTTCVPKHLHLPSTSTPHTSTGTLRTSSFPSLPFPSPHPSTHPLPTYKPAHFRTPPSPFRPVRVRFPSLVCT